MLAGAGKWSVREAHCERKGISGTTTGCCLTRPPRTRPRISRGRAGLHDLDAERRARIVHRDQVEALEGEQRNAGCHQAAIPCVEVDAR